MVQVTHSFQLLLPQRRNEEGAKSRVRLSTDGTWSTTCNLARFTTPRPSGRRSTWCANPASDAQVHSCQLRPTSVGCSHREGGWWRPWLWRMFSGDQSSARGSGWPRPPCRSLPAGCPASAPPARRSRRALHLPRCPHSWHGSQAALAHSFAESSPPIHNLLTQTGQGNKRYHGLMPEGVKWRTGNWKNTAGRVISEYPAASWRASGYFPFTNPHSLGQKEHTCCIQRTQWLQWAYKEASNRDLQGAGSQQRLYSATCFALKKFEAADARSNNSSQQLKQTGWATSPAIKAVGSGHMQMVSNTKAQQMCLLPLVLLFLLKNDGEWVSRRLRLLHTIKGVFRGADKTAPIS